MQVLHALWVERACDFLMHGSAGWCLGACRGCMLVDVFATPAALRMGGQRTDQYALIEEQGLPVKSGFNKAGT